MILVEDVKCRPVRGDYTQLIHFSDDLLIPKRLPEGTRIDHKAGRIEHVRGREFCDPRTGRRVTIGLSEKALEVFDIPWRCIEDQTKEIGRLMQENNGLRNTVIESTKQISAFKKQFQEMPFWQRCMFCFNFVIRGGSKMFIEKEDESD